MSKMQIGDVVEPTNPELSGHRGVVCNLSPFTVDWGFYGRRVMLRPVTLLRYIGVDPDYAAQGPEED